MDLSDLQAVAVGCLVDRQPFPGAWVRVTVGMERKNPLASLHGPADAEGIVRIAGQDLVGWAQQTIGLAIMDHGDPRGEWSGELCVEPVGLRSVEKALDAYDAYASSGSFPPEYQEGIEALRCRLEQVRHGALAMRILSIQPPDTCAVTAPRRPRPAAES